jgi:hypothetical protein
MISKALCMVFLRWIPSYKGRSELGLAMDRSRQEEIEYLSIYVCSNIEGV